MAFSLFSHSWSFPSNNYGQINGIADSGVETFKGTPLKSLAREICQNSIDANNDPSKPTLVEFVPFEIPVSNIPDSAGLLDALKRARDFWDRQQSTKAKAFFDSAIKVMNKATITCLRISDHNTSGLTGSNEEYNSPWCNLTKSTGASDKSGTNGGSFGIGKFAPYACSSLRTVFYSTADSEGVFAYQGVSRLTSFKDKGGEITQGTGFYGEKKNAPVAKQLTLDPAFSRQNNDFGTDLYVLGFADDRDWKHQMVASILDGFLYAIYTGKLIANVAGIEVSKETLPQLMDTHKSFFLEHAEEYYQALIADEKLSPTFKKEISEPGCEGTITLRLMIMPEFHRRVAMVRQTGMKIKDKGNINGLIPFAGLLYIEGDNLNSFLRNLENPQHLEWEIERADDKSKAKLLINSFTRFIKQSLDELKNDDSEEALDPAVGEYLSAESADAEKEEEKAENINDTVRTIEVHVAPRNPKSNSTQSSGEGTVEVDDENGDVVVEDEPGKGGREGDAPGGRGEGGGGHGEGDSGGDDPIEHRKSFVSIAPAKSRVVCSDKNQGEYVVSFTPTSTAADGVMDLFMSAESQNYEAPILSAVCDEIPNLMVSGNRLSGIAFAENHTVRIKIKLDYHDYCSMEVKAYGNKI